MKEGKVRELKEKKMEEEELRLVREWCPEDEEEGLFIQSYLFFSNK